MNLTEQFVYICACAATGHKAQLESADFDALWKMSRSHNMTALVAKGLQPTVAFKNADGNERHRWENALNNNIKKTMRFDAERAAVTKFLEENGIWHLPLKGIVINRLYKSYGPREFADNDILVDSKRTDDCKRFMLDRGYVLRCDSFEADEYSKEPFFNFEIHRTLVEPGEQSENAANYYSDVKSRLIKDDGSSFGFRFSDDDFYVYFIFHAFKHYDSKGTGLRTVADEYVVLHNKSFDFDFENIDRELEKLGILEFEHGLRSLAEALFSNPEKTVERMRKLDPAQLEMLKYILSSGTFGSLDNIFEKDFEQQGGSKAAYWRKRVFPPISRYKYSHPFIYKTKVFYPFFLVYRLGVYPIVHRDTLKKEIDVVNKIEK